MQRLGNRWGRGQADRRCVVSGEECRYPYGCDQFDDEHCSCMDGHTPVPSEATEAGEGRLDALIAAAENPEPPCRDCEVGEPHVCPLDPAETDAGEVEALAKVLAEHRSVFQCDGDYGRGFVTAPTGSRPTNDHPRHHPARRILGLRGSRRHRPRAHGRRSRSLRGHMEVATMNAADLLEQLRATGDADERAWMAAALGGAG